jgi:hypothetical protein
MDFKKAIAECLYSHSTAELVNTITTISHDVRSALQQTEEGNLRWGDSGEQTIVCLQTERLFGSENDLGYLKATYRIKQYDVTVFFSGRTCLGIKSLKIPHGLGDVVLSEDELKKVFPVIEAWRPRNSLFWLALALVQETHHPKINPRTLCQK